MTTASLSLVADIGGTNTRVALADGGVIREASVRRYRNDGFNGIDEVLARYMTDESVGPVAGACVAAAGPLRHGHIVMTNLFDADGQPWVIDEGRVSRATGAARVAILNDLQAQGQALGHIAPDHLHRVIDGPVEDGASMLVVGLGTGVNAAPVHNTPWGRVVPPSECGHVNLPAQTEEDLRLLRFLEALLAGRGEVAHAGVEEALSGRGLANLHAFAASEAGRDSSAASAEVLAALAQGEPVATHAARLYTRILAQTLADLALIHLPYGGIYLIGGMSQAMAPHFGNFGLTETFRRPRRVALMQNEFSVTVVADDYAALTGCAVYLANGGKG
ncbi:glucokinase [Gemmobacter denitrificans]|uniref:Glucokinase n=1 Tax=Gemmobacter denitrificans TaxID=3123040 RepID=A0ABU8BQJ4_9RHOB